ncbi:MAG: hypothetical protein IKO75_10555 [Bacteroidales bacterium]|nr:hypothetical protein [Bacteroidales bacterium]
MSKLLNCISAAELRQRLESREQKTVEDLPGVYRWWFPKAEAEKLLEKFTTPLQKEDRTLQEWEHGGITYQALYFGMSSNLRRRIRWHIRGPFKSSTLRRTLRALKFPFKNDENPEDVVNQLIDTCLWEWEYTKDTKEAKDREEKELSQDLYAYPLNISENKTMTSEWITELKNLRKNRNCKTI